VTFLELVQSLAVETGNELQVNITDVTETPAANYGSTTEHINRMIRWIKQAWIDIQSDQIKPSWRFMVTDDTMNLSVGQTIYDIRQSIETDVGVDQYDGIEPWVAPMDRRYVWAVNGNTDPLTKQKCYYMVPEHFFGDRDRYNNDQGQPYVYSFKPDGCIVVDPAPSETGWYLEFEYRLREQTLSANTDTPTGLPNKFHMLIVYQAMLDNGAFDESPMQYQRANRKYRLMMNKLRLEQLGDYSMPGTR
jgi:hypothetical protein